MIMAHNEFHMLKKLLTELDDDRNDIFIHIDKKTKYVNEDEISSWVSKSKVFFIPRRAIYWGHISIVKCELDLLKAATKGNYHYYHLLSGMDFPLKTQDEIHAFFVNEDREFVRYHFNGDDGDEFLYKIKYYFPFIGIVGKDSHAGPGRKKKILRKISEWQWRFYKFQERIGVDRTKRYADSAIVKGSQWFSITHDFALYLLSKQKEILKRYRFTNAPDEFFVPNLAMNSDFLGRVINSDIREIDWKRGDPYVYKIDDLDRLTGSEALFARKISYDDCPELVEALITHLHPEKKNEENVLVSVVVPCYNVEKYLDKCLESLVSQKYSKLEILVIDDGSVDDTKTIAKKYADRYENVFYHYRENGGLSAARNTGIDLAAGEYIAFVDSDDWVEPDYIEKLYEALKDTRSRISVCGYKKEELKQEIVSFDKADVISSHAVMKILGDIFPKENNLLVIACNKLYEKSLFDDMKFREGKIHEDEYMAHRIIGKVDYIAVVTDVLYHYRIREGSIVAKDNRQDIRHIDYLGAVEDRLDSARTMMFGDLMVYELYAYYEVIKELSIAYSEDTIKENRLYSYFRKKSLEIYLKEFKNLDSYQKKEYLIRMLFPARCRTLEIQKRNSKRCGPE